MCCVNRNARLTCVLIDLVHRSAKICIIPAFHAVAQECCVLSSTPWGLPAHLTLAASALVVKSVDTADLKSADANTSCPFESGPGHQSPSRRRRGHCLTWEGSAHTSAPHPHRYCSQSGSPTERTSKKGVHFHGLPLHWSGIRGSNSRPIPWQGIALPTELIPHVHLMLSDPDA
jgi:hypothetical protein